MSNDARQVFQRLQQADEELGRKHPWLKHQDAIGALILTASVLGAAALSLSYLKCLLPGWVVLPAIAILYSFLHELEHDLIHRQYFCSRTRVQNAMFFLIWMLNGNTVNPWYRRKLHLLHHRESGQDGDIEERLLGNGTPWDFKRVLMTLDSTWISILRLKPLAREIPELIPKELLRSRFPVGLVYTGTWVSFVAICTLTLLGAHPFSTHFGSVIQALMVCLVGPNMLRQSVLSFVSSNCHYHGIPRSKLHYQGQVINHWAWAPLQLFCCNFGSTHIIHHFYVTQPFYRRELMGRRAQAILKDAGVRFNDLKSIAYGNAWIQAGGQKKRHRFTNPWHLSRFCRNIRPMQNLITIDMIDDWAGAAMQGFISAKARDKDLDLGLIADAAYELANEMARARGEFIEQYESSLHPVDEDGEHSRDDDGLS